MVGGQNEEEVTDRSNEALSLIGASMAERGQEVSPHKCEYITFTGKRKIGSINLKIGALPLQMRNTVKYLGVTLDKELRFSELVLERCEKPRGR